MNDPENIKALSDFIGEDFTKTGRFIRRDPPIQNLKPNSTEESRKNHEMMLKFLKETEYIEETAMDNDPCEVCGYNALCEKCEHYKKLPEISLPKSSPKRKNRYDLLKEGLHESR